MSIIGCNIVAQIVQESLVFGVCKIFLFLNKCILLFNKDAKVIITNLNVTNVLFSI